MFREARSCAKKYLEFYLRGKWLIKRERKRKTPLKQDVFFPLLTCEGGDAKTAAAAFATDGRRRKPAYSQISSRSFSPLTIGAAGVVNSDSESRLRIRC